jgi:hypothetical protein
VADLLFAAVPGFPAQASGSDPAANWPQLTQMIIGALPANVPAGKLKLSHDERRTLTVTAPPVAQAAVGAAIERLSADRLSMANVQGEIYCLSPAAVRQLHSTVPMINGTDDRAAAKIVSEDQLSDLLAAAVADKQTTRLTMPRLTLFNHQRGDLLISDERTYVADYIPAASDRPTGSFEPRIATFPALYMRADIRIEIAPDHRSTSVCAKIDVARLIKFAESSWRNRDDLRVQVPVQSVVSADKTFRLPDGRSAIVASQVSPVTGELEMIIVRATAVQPPHRG